MVQCRNAINLSLMCCCRPLFWMKVQFHDNRRKRLQSVQLYFKYTNYEESFNCLDIRESSVVSGYMYVSLCTFYFVNSTCVQQVYLSLSHSFHPQRSFLMLIFMCFFFYFCSHSCKRVRLTCRLTRDIDAVFLFLTQI